MSISIKPPRKKPLTILQKFLLAGLILSAILLISGFIWRYSLPDEPQEAPEMDAILSAQANLPFQVLIPAYLPGGFARKEVAIQTDQTGPLEEAMAVLTYTHQSGVELVLNEWIPDSSVVVSPPDLSASGAPSNPVPCTCVCQNWIGGDESMLMVDVGALLVAGYTSDPQILSPGHVQAILKTLGPAAGLLVYSKYEAIPITFGMPPAVDVLIDENGVQEIVLVVTPQGYNPVHFAVRKDIPVRLIFRQLGEVGCGNELYIQYGSQQPGYLFLSDPGDEEIFEFTPGKTGDYPIYCPHVIYQGVMTVLE